MLSIEEAQKLVFDSTARLPAAPHALADCLGLVLAEDVASDLDMPPYDKALVDGFAVRAADLPDGRGELVVVAEVFAGETPSEKSAAVAAGQAVRIMTGAPVPPGADCVVMVERTSQGSRNRDQGSGPLSTQYSVLSTEQPLVGGGEHRAATARLRVSIDDSRLKPGQNIMRRATELRRGQVVLKSGTLIRPPEIGLLAEVGRAEVPVYRRPRVAIISTGNEIVEASEVPRPGQIRNSNGPTIVALVARAGGQPEYLGIARDTRDELVRLAQRGLEADILILSGGVSAGELDLVPGVLRELGVREVFHKVQLKPGKPIWFGLATNSAINQQSAISNPQCLVFGLPGNPVSVIVCFELFVRPAIRKMLGIADPLPRGVSASLTEDKADRSDRPTYWPAWLELRDDGYHVRPVAWHGSPDLRATTDANAFVVFPVGEHQYRTGDRVQVLPIEW